MDPTGSGSSIAVIWYDCGQQCTVLNVFPREHNEDTINDPLSGSSSRDSNDDTHNGIHNHELISRGILNAAFDGTRTELDGVIDQARASSSSNLSNDTPYSSLSGSSSNNPTSEHMSEKTSVKRTPICRSCSSLRSTSIHNVQFSHNNPAFEMPSEISFADTVKASPIHPNVYLVRKRNSVGEPIRRASCMCLSNVLANGRLIETPSATPQSPATPQPGGDGDDPPPQYSSLRFMFLEDEPPKYQDVTGKKLAMIDPPKIQRVRTGKWKRRAIVFAVIVFIILIGALLVYACFVSGHPLGAYGTVPRKF